MAEEKDVKLAAAMYTTILQANFIKPEYKEFGKKYKENPEVLKEIILCACDGVDTLLMQAAESKLPVANSFAHLRRKHWERQLFQRYHEELESITYTVNSIEAGMRAVSSQISVIEDKVPTMEELFQNRKPLEPQEAIEISEDMTITKDMALQSSGINPIVNIGTTSLIEDIKSVLVVRAQAKKARAEANRQKKRAEKVPLSSWFSMLEKQGYTAEQMKFILECIDDGMEKKTIERIIAPNLSVDIMMSLKKIEIKKEEATNGKR